MLRIEIVDDRSVEDEVWVHRVPLDTDKVKLLEAIAILYPSASEIHFYVEEDD